MKTSRLMVVFVTILMISSLFLTLRPENTAQAQTTPDVYFGIDMGYATDVAGTKAAIDKVSDFTNFFVLGTYGISMNISALNETLQYAYDKGLYFASFAPILYRFNRTTGEYWLQPSTEAWLNYTKSTWGDRFVGFMYPYEDEPGGHQLDLGGQYQAVNFTETQPQNFQQAADHYVNSEWFIDINRAKNLTGYPLFVSDYSLYWFDYKGGYDCVFAEFGWNYSRQINVALARGAATVQNKDWGVIICYTYTTPPYMESGEELYKDLVYAYDSGAKYIAIFDSNDDWTGSILTEEHYEAMRQFWEYVQKNPRNLTPAYERVAYELPEAFGYGFRGPVDTKIWGFWNISDSDTTAGGVMSTNQTTVLISTAVKVMLDHYGTKLDIIYKDTPKTGEIYSYPYNKIIPWNDPEAVADLWPSTAPQPTPSPTPTEMPTPTPPTPTPTVTETAPTPSSSPTLQVTPTQTAKPTFMIPETYLWAIIAVTAAACITAALLIVKRRLRLAQNM